MKKKALVVILLLCGTGLLATGIYYQFFNKNSKDEPKNKEDTLVVNQLWVDFNNGKINADKYVKYNIYNLYDRNLLEEKYHYDSEIKIDDLIDKYYDDLSEDTIKLYLDYYSLSNITFESESDASQVKPIASGKQEEDTTNLNKVYLSSNKNFLIWYTDEGNSSVSYEKVEKYGELLENAIQQYDNIFDLKYSFNGKVLSEGTRYKKQKSILNNNNINEKYMTDAMHVYIYDFNNEKLRGTYCNINYSNNKLVDFINNYLYSSEDGTIITPYISLNSELFNKKNYNFEDVLNHELFHHYQNCIINNTGSRKSVTDTVIGEATAQWAAAKITKNEERNNGLNTWVSNYLKHTNDLFTDMYDQVGTEVGYATFKFLESYEQIISDGRTKIFDSIHSDDGFKYLHENAKKEERVKVIKDLSIKNLNDDYSNNNYLSANNEKLRIKKEITKGTNYNEKLLTLSKIGIDYYSFKPELKDNYEVEISSVGSDSINVWVVLKKENGYQIVTSKNNIVGSFIVNTLDYSNYEIGYIVVANSDFDGLNLYDITIKKSNYLPLVDTNNTIKWGTQQPIKFRDKKYGVVDIVAYGNFTYQVLDGSSVDEYGESQMFNSVLQAFYFTIRKYEGESYASLSYLINQEKENILNDANSFFDNSSFKIVDIEILSINITDESRDKINETLSSND